MARERANQVCVIFDNVIIDRLNDAVEHSGSSRSKIVAQWINSYFNAECALKDYEARAAKLQQDLQALQQEKDTLESDVQNRDNQLIELDNQKEELERFKFELQSKEEEFRDLKSKKQEVSRLQVQVERLQIELNAKDNEIKRLEDNLGYLRLEHTKLREEIAAPLTRLLTAATDESKVKKWWQFWKRKAAGSQK
jgi:chromosome segregation ATPase